jgi:hypothetical protein
MKKITFLSLFALLMLKWRVEANEKTSGQPFLLQLDVETPSSPLVVAYPHIFNSIYLNGRQSTLATSYVMSKPKLANFTSTETSDSFHLSFDLEIAISPSQIRTRVKFGKQLNPNTKLK